MKLYSDTNNYHLYKLLGQRDPEWANLQLGGGGVTIGHYGCVITSYAMMVGLTPDVVNDRLKKARQFSGSNVSVARTKWDKAGGAIHTYQSRWYTGLVDDEGMELMFNHVTLGQPLMVLVDISPVRPDVQTHFMCGTDIRDNELVVYDPWFRTVDKIGDIRGGKIYGGSTRRAVYRFDKFVIARS